MYSRQRNQISITKIKRKQEDCFCRQGTIGNSRKKGEGLDIKATL